jgi:hypothetical protein
MSQTISLTDIEKYREIITVETNVPYFSYLYKCKVCLSELADNEGVGYTQLEADHLFVMHYVFDHLVPDLQTVLSRMNITLPLSLKKRN